MKILIITNKLETITNILNFLTLNFDNISVLVANDLNSAKQIVLTDNIKLIIFEKSMFNLDFYENNLNLIPIVLINDSYDYDELTLNNFKCISLDNLKFLYNILYKFISYSNICENAKKNILKELVKLGFNIKHNGTQYIAEAIIILKFYHKAKCIEDIYSIIAKKYNTNSHNIKENILQSINYMYCETKFEDIKSYFSLVEDMKPTPKQTILTIFRNLN